MKILFPTDFSKAADNAFVYALNLAHAVGGSVTTVHVYSIPDLGGASLPNTLQEIYDSIELESFEDYKDNVPHLRNVAAENNMEHVVVKHVMRQSAAGIVQAILNVSSELEADFIVLGTTGASGLKEIFVGSVAGEVLENAKCPVLAIPQEARFDGKIDRIAYGTEYSDSDMKALRRTIGIADSLSAGVLCVHVNTSNTEDLTNRMSALRDEVGDVGKIDYAVVDHTNVKTGLTEFVNDNHVDVLALRVKKRNFLQELFTYSTAKNLTHRLSIPILGLPIE